MKCLAALWSRASESFQYLFVLKERPAWSGLKVKWKVNPAFKWQLGQPWGILYGLSCSILFSVIEICSVLMAQCFLSSQTLHLSLIAAPMCAILCPASLHCRSVHWSSVTSNSPGLPSHGKEQQLAPFSPWSSSQNYQGRSIFLVWQCLLLGLTLSPGPPSTLWSDSLCWCGYFPGSSAGTAKYWGQTKSSVEVMSARRDMPRSVLVFSGNRKELRCGAFLSLQLTTQRACWESQSWPLALIAAALGRSQLLTSGSHCTYEPGFHLF